MDSSKKYCNPSPENTANPISKLFFWWVIPFFKYGYSNNLGMKDVYNTMNSDKSENVANELERNWKNVITESSFKNTKPSLLIAIRKTFWKSFSIAGVIIMLRIVIYSYFMPMVLSEFIKIFNEVPRNVRKGCYLGATLISMNFLNCLIAHQGNLYTKRLGMRVRVACCSIIYRKVLKLNKTSLDDTDVGMLVNLLSNDVNRFDFAASVLHFIWIMPIQAVIGTYVMYDFVGAVAFVGIGAMVLQAVPVQGYFSRLQGKLRMEIASRTDSRMKLMHEIISGIQMIKMYAWEKPFEQMVAQLRKCEILLITKTSYIKACSTSVQVFTERVSLYIIVVTYVLTGNGLTGSVVFAMSQAINFLQLVVCIMFPMAISGYAEAKASINRIEKFLSKDERHDPVKKTVNTCQTGSVKLSNVNARWQENIETLIDISFEIKPGSFCCIVGTVGSGKSSILLSLLREMPITSGKIETGGVLSYASQEPWLFGSDIRSNILFGQTFCKERYENVLEACALKRDLQNFLHGDNTTIGDRGMTLSGGQRARIGLARCVYREADVYLLDDPLSAVDPHVAKRIVEKCILEFLQGKTRIVVTHHIEFLNHADVVLFLKDGKMEKFLKPSELSKNELNIIRQTSNVELKENKLLEEKAESMLSLGSLDYENDKEEEEENKTKETQELMKKSLISFSVYRDYYRAGASTLVLLFEMFLFLIAQSFCMGSDLWITYWTNNMDQSKKENSFSPRTYAQENATNSSTVKTDEHVNNTLADTVWSMIPHTLNEDLYIQVYTFLIICGVILTVWRSIFFYKICLKSSENLHNIMFLNIMQAKMKFYDLTASGKILNRFSKDMGAIDEQLPSVTLLSVQVILIGIGISTLVIVKSPWMAIPTVVIGVFVFWFRKVFLKGAQDVKRLEGKSKGPVFSYVAATLNGITTIRSANAEKVLKREFDILQDQHSATWYLLLVLFDAFGFFLNTISIVFLSILTFQSLFDAKALSGDVGLIVSQSLIIIGVLQLGARNTADVATHMTSVERVLKYTRLDKEGPFESICKPSAFWPQAGRIKFVNVNSTLSLGEGPVLKDVTIEIEPGEKIGIVGRTGAGKSSLVSALFRLISIEGSIEIDGVDIMKVGLIDLRSGISVIPQEPVLFSGSIRYNLDPFGKCDEQTLWQALYCVELRHAIENLEMNVSEGGSNFSVGQRQLICLARAIIRDNKILVMDEATANVDPTTDALIQKSIRKNFKHCTVLTVAHRLNTIMDSDRVIVMDTGRVHEFAPPHELLQDPTSLFSKMVAKNGSVMEIELKRIAKEHYYSKEQN